MPSAELAKLAQEIRKWGADAGFDDLRITEATVGQHGPWFDTWLAADLHGGPDGDLGYLERHRDLRVQPAALEPGTVRVISARMNYLSADDPQPVRLLSQPELGYVARYSLGRDYHKVLRRRLAKLATRLKEEAGAGVARAFTDSAPVLEKGLAERAGLGWIGKNTLLLNADAGSFFFLGEIYTDLELPVDPPSPQPGCGKCSACITVCPTQAFVGPQQLDARRCISYLTIENKGSIPEEFRVAIGNRIFGCDDCQLFCPWNRYAQPSREADFAPRNGLDKPDLLELWGWDEQAFLKNTEGSAIRRINYRQWRRNLAIALGNSPKSEAVVAALQSSLAGACELVAEHIHWALAQQTIPAD
ncbi:MAG: tRNA epoxyqueuosine(34) reductase QueG [Pseudomonadaceae bacterium]|nr:tRNA epoxyqueuosine(34) reductase QueG [Pseudomonadaceae bacterium]